MVLLLFVDIYIIECVHSPCINQLRSYHLRFIKAYVRCVAHIILYTVIQKTRPLSLCRIALSFHIDFSKKSTICLRKSGAVNGNLIRVPPTAGVQTLLCNVNDKITLMCTVHVTQLKC